MAKANKFVKNDEGVSAVIGVILMVAITVILAAVIAAFVFQLSSNVPKNKQVGVEVKRVTPGTATTGVIYVKTMSGSDIGQLLQGTAAGRPTYNVTYSGGQAAFLTSTGAAASTDAHYNANSIGAMQFFRMADNQDITVVANFQDGTQFPVWAGVVA